MKLHFGVNRPNHRRKEGAGKRPGLQKVTVTAHNWLKEVTSLGQDTPWPGGLQTLPRPPKRQRLPIIKAKYVTFSLQPKYSNMLPLLSAKLPPTPHTRISGSGHALACPTWRLQVRRTPRAGQCPKPRPRWANSTCTLKPLPQPARDSWECKRGTGPGP